MRLTLATQNMVEIDAQGDITIRAIRIGPLAVHRRILSGLAFAPGRYSVTHIRSGRSVAPSLCCRESAIGLAEALQAFDWDFTVSRSWRWSGRLPKRVQESMRKAGKIIAGWKCPTEAWCKE